MVLPVVAADAGPRHIMKFDIIYETSEPEYYIDITSEQRNEIPTIVMAADTGKFIKITDQESKKLLEFFKENKKKLSLIKTMNIYRNRIIIL